MNGHVYQTHGESDDRRQWTRTTEELALYINKHMEHAGDMGCVCKTFEKPTIEKPEKPPVDENGVMDEVDKEIWKEEIKQYVKRKATVDANMRKIYAVVWGQCSEGMKAKVMSFDDFKTHDDTCDCIWLLKTIRSVSYQFDEQKDIFLANIEARAKLENCQQRSTETTAQFFEQFNTLVDAFEHCGGTIGQDKGLLLAMEDRSHQGHPDQMPGPVSGEDATTALQKLREHITHCRTYESKIHKQCRDRYLAMLFLRRLDRRRYGGLWRDLHNQHARGNSEYPQDLNAAYTLAIAYKIDRPP